MATLQAAVASWEPACRELAFTLLVGLPAGIFCFVSCQNLRHLYGKEFFWVKESTGRSIPLTRKDVCLENYHRLMEKDFTPIAGFLEREQYVQRFCLFL